MNALPPRRIVVNAGLVSATAALGDTATADAIWDALPLEGVANRWGDEVWFEIPLRLPPADDARDVMEVGELAYWPAGAGFCIFFGATPVSRSGEPRAADAVNPFGRLEDDPQDFSRVETGDLVVVEAAPA